jgi:hypothetical protein
VLNSEAAQVFPRSRKQYDGGEVQLGGLRSGLRRVAATYDGTSSAISLDGNLATTSVVEAMPRYDFVGHNATGLQLGADGN